MHLFSSYYWGVREVWKGTKEFKIVYEFYWYNELENYTIALSPYLNRLKSRTLVGKLSIAKTQNLWMYKYNNVTSGYY